MHNGREIVHITHGIDMSLRRAHSVIDHNPLVIDGHFCQIKVKTFDVGPAPQGLENLLADVGPFTSIFHHPQGLPSLVVGHTQQLHASDDFDALVDQCGFKRASDILVHLRKQGLSALKNCDSRP